MILQARHRTITFPRRPLVMGIVNLSPDSFSGDGVNDADAALEIARTMIAAGTDIIDVGAESARADREAIPVGEEIARLAPFLRAFPELVDGVEAAPFDADQLWPPLLSVNTWRPATVKAALSAGADLLNDIGGLADARNAELCAERGAALLIMHSVGRPKQPHRYQRWN
ncbi:MAG: dihydropteroate synthase, partial [Verrucomicrobiales bacterium]